MIQAFFYGVILSFGLIIPLGIQNIFIFNQGATQKRLLHAMPSVFTAFVCDTILILCAVLGVSILVFTIPWLKNLIFVGGFLFLTYMGFLTWKSKTQSNNDKEPLSAKYQIGFALSVSLLNPHALIDTVGVIGTNSLNFVGYDKVVFTLACILVSLLWFLGLSLSGHYFQKVDKKGNGIKYLNKFSAIIIWMVAGYIGWQLLT